MEMKYVQCHKFVTDARQPIFLAIKLMGNDLISTLWTSIMWHFLHLKTHDDTCDL